MVRTRVARVRAAKAALTVTALIAGVLTVTSSVSASNPVLLVTTTADSGAGSLRSAITAANNAFGADTIHFAIPGCSPCTITPTSALPVVMFQPIVIDGFTQDPSLGRPAIIIDGTNLRSNPNSANLEFIRANNSTVRGLALVGGRTGAFIFSDDFVFEQNWVGTADGVTAQGNLSHGVFIRAGGQTNLKNITLRDNVIAGNGYSVTVTSFNGVDTVDNVIIDRNLVGTTAAGSPGLPNGSGIGLDAIRNSATVTGNTIRSNGGYGVVIGSPSTTWVKSSGVVVSRNSIEGNALGGIRIFPGSNANQAPPSITAATQGGISGTVPGSGSGVKVELFTATCDANGAQGRTFLGDGVTEEGATGSFTVVPSTPPPQGGTVTATASGTSGTSAFATCATVTVPAASPVGVDDVFEVASNQQLTVPGPGVLANDTDANGDALSATLISASANGEVVLSSDGGFVYTPPPDFGGLFVFTYRASDGALESATTTAMIDVRPAPPMVGEVSGTLDDQIQAVVSFAPITDPFYGSIDYTATCTADGGVTASATGTTTPITVTGLTPGPRYRCTVTATNVGGTSPESDPTEPLATADPPGPPVIDPAATVVVDADRSAPIMVAPPTSDGGTPVLGYEVTCTSSNGGATRVTSADTSPISVTALSPGKTYTCRAVARNAIGLGSPSAATKPFTMPSSPGRPADVTAALNATRSVSVSFDAPDFVGTTAITQYTLRCQSSDGGVTPANVVGATSPLVMTGLTAGKTYTCRVLAQNTAGSSAYSTPSNAFTVFGLPDVPQDVVAAAAGSTKATVSFQAPADNGSPAVTQYTVTCTPTAGGTARTAIGATSPLTVTALAAGGTYTCTARATNSAGTGPTSAPSAAVTLPLPPVPEQVTVTMAGTTATIAFEPGAANGSDAVTSNVATCTSANGGVTKAGTVNVPATSIRITGFTAGAIYTCTVAARAGSISGAASAPSEEFTVATVPTAPPGSVSVSLDGSGRIAVIRFTPPASGGSDVLDYRLFCGGSTTVAAIVTRSPLVLGNLAAGTTSCELKARNIVGLSDGAPVSITPAGLAGAPTDVEVEVAGSRTAVIVTFTPVTVAAGTQPVAWHRVFCTPTAGGTTRTATVVAGPAIVTGLVAGTEYSCTVAAGTPTGSLGASSAPVIVTTG